MTLELQVCSLELAQKLKELGVKQESIWAWWIATDRDDTPALNRHPDKDCPTCGHPSAPYFEWISAFTVAELGEMLPELYNTYHDSNPIGGLETWECVAEDTNEDIPFFRAETEADARAKMLIYLLENNLITL